METRDIIERINEVKRVEKLSYGKISKLTGIDSERWKSVFLRRVQPRYEEIELLAKAFPEYKYWLLVGEEIPQAGQISPITKETQKNLGTQGKAG